MVAGMGGGSSRRLPHVTPNPTLLPNASYWCFYRQDGELSRCVAWPNMAAHCILISCHTARTMQIDLAMLQMLENILQHGLRICSILYLLTFVNWEHISGDCLPLADIRQRVFMVLRGFGRLGAPLHVLALISLLNHITFCESYFL